MIEKLLKVHRDSTEIDFKKLWNEGVFIFDSNVVLDLYRLPISARDDLISVFENKDFNPRIWIGFQVAIEFLNNRYEAIGDQKNKFNDVRSLLDVAKSDYETMISELTNGLGKLKLSKRHSLIDPDKFINKENSDKGMFFIQDFIEDLQKLEVEQTDVNDVDEIKDVVFNVFEGKVGQGFNKDELEEIYKEAEVRYENDVPPGFRDKAKKGSYIFENKEYIRKFGDLILWKEIVQKAKSENLKYVVLVTGDVKPDWWLEKRGKKLGPRRELLNEIYSEVESLEVFHMYDTSNFLKYAKNELKLNIKESSIAEAKDLIEFGREKDELFGSYLIDVYKMLEEFGSSFSNVNVIISNGVKHLPLLGFETDSLYFSVAEILSNVAVHGNNKIVSVSDEKIKSNIVLKFSNSFDRVASLSAFDEFKESQFFVKGSSGLFSAKKMLQSEGVDMNVFVSEDVFTVELYIPVSKVVI